MKILFTGGGTGGHVLPIIAVAREIRKFSPQTKVEFFYLGPRDDFSKLLLSQEGIYVKHVAAGKMRRYFTPKSFFQNLLDLIFKTPLGIIQSFFYIFFLAPDLILSKGGFGSIPGVVAGWLLGTPIFLHEADSIPGLSNRILASFSREVFISFRKTPYFSERKMILVGNPIRRELLEVEPKEEAKKLFKFHGEKPIILVLGGSQGAQRINDRLLDILPNFLKEFYVIHQCGEKNYSQVKAEAKAITKEWLEKSYRAFPFLKEDELKKAYSACDLVISRAGSGTIFEIAAFGKPSILVPLPESAQGHQVKNAYTYAEKGAAIVLEEANFTSRFVLEKLRFLFSNPQELEKMSKAAREFAKPLAGKTMAGYILTFLNVPHQKQNIDSQPEEAQN